MPEPDVYQIADQQIDYVEKWHNGQDPELAHDLDGLAGMVIDQMRFNYRLWHEEDEARRTDVDDSIIAQVKRNIDKLNQMRNDAIEVIDEYIITEVFKNSLKTDDNATLNTETPGSAFDRLSIAALRIHHLKEDLDRDDVDELVLNGVGQPLHYAAHVDGPPGDHRQRGGGFDPGREARATPERGNPRHQPPNRPLQSCFRRR